MSTYTVEYAKSGRSSCKKCKEKIGKDEIRLGSHSDTGEYSMSSWHHPKCFNVPRKLKISAEEFVQDHLEDTSEDGSILPDKAEEITEAIESKPAKAAKAAGDGGAVSFVDKLKAEYNALNEPEEGKKKRKGATSEDEPSPKKSKSDDGDSENQRALDAYGKYHKMNADQLKDLLRWNRQVLKGTKPVILHKVIDGEIHGRLPLCGVCDGGKLKINDECSKVVCGGTFDEESMQRMSCGVSYTFADAPRAHWYTAKPTEEETAEMDKADETAKGIAPEEVDEDSDLGKLVKAAEDVELDMSNNAAIKKSAKKMVNLLEDSDAKLDLPDSEKDILKAVGSAMMANKEASTTEMVKLLVKKFGFVGAKVEKQAKKEQAVAESCQCAANAALCAAFSELSELYFKEKNANAGATFKKVANAIRDMTVEVTGANALAMGKAGKNKVAGIGASSAKKMHEFVTTGTMEKLEEKRANAE